ncbi:hypothetical protein D3C87_1293420 [compost metagenome]
MAKVLFLFPSLASCPFMRFFYIRRPESIQVTVLFLRFANDGDQRIDITFHTRVFFNLHGIRCTFYNFVDIRIVKSKL